MFNIKTDLVYSSVLGEYFVGGTFIIKKNGAPLDLKLDPLQISGSMRKHRFLCLVPLKGDSHGGHFDTDKHG